MADDDDENVIPIKPAPAYALPDFVPTGETMCVEFERRYGERLRHVAPWGKWFIWDQGVWAEDETLRVVDLAGLLARDIGGIAKKRRERMAIEASRTVSSLERRARSAPALAARVEAWDVDPLLLNGPRGTVDLATGHMRGHRREDYCTRATAVSPTPAPPLRWLTFLQRVTGGNADLIGFLQRVCGYCLTGRTDEQCLFFVWGPGGNGKGTFVHTITNILGGYARAAAIETFVETRYERHPEELATLRGARLVTASETEEGRAWNESRIKALTGGDVVRARFMRMDSFEYVPQFKLLIIGNKKPAFKSIDRAVRRRLHLIPFTVEISDEERDKLLDEHLRGEWPAILHWMVQGGLEWRTRGLAPPAVVAASTAEYLEAEDAVGTWLEECCDRLRDSFTASAALFAGWKAWAEARGERVGTIRTFVQNLQGRGFVLGRTDRARGFRDLILTPEKKRPANDGDGGDGDPELWRNR